MRKEYDFSKSVKNPYAKHLTKQVTLRSGTDVRPGEGPKNVLRESEPPCSLSDPGHGVH